MVLTSYSSAIVITVLFQIVFIIKFYGLPIDSDARFISSEFDCVFSTIHVGLLIFVLRTVDRIAF